MEVIRSVDFAARRDRSADYDWSTRFMRANTATEQGEKTALRYAKLEFLLYVCMYVLYMCMYARICMCVCKACMYVCR